MNKSMTIVMYHYVRELELSRYPKIKGLNTSEFKNQLSFFAQNYSFVTAEQILDCLTGGKMLPENAVHLTFDDGYTDHYTNVFPLLMEFGAQGSFFPPSRPILEATVLDVNKIHLILASSSINVVLQKLKYYLTILQSEFNLLTYEDYYKIYGVAGRLDDADTMFIKKMLQRELSEQVRQIIIQELYDELVGVPEKIMSRELYASPEQLRVMYRNGMVIGSHSYNHYHMDTLLPVEQEQEVDKSLELLHSIDPNMSVRSLCYPYGGYNESLKQILENKGFHLAYTIKSTRADLSHANRFSLQRFDTNEFPK